MTIPLAGACGRSIHGRGLLPRLPPTSGCGAMPSRCSRLERATEVATVLRPGERGSQRARRPVVFTPSPETVSATQMTAFRRVCERATGLPIPDEGAVYL